MPRLWPVTLTVSLLFLTISGVSFAEVSKPNPRTAEPSETTAPEFKATLGIFSGVGFPPPNSDIPFDHRVLFGGQAEVKYGWVGVEGDVFYGAGLGEALNQWGSFTNGKLNLPLQYKDVEVIPNIGVGWGVLNQQDKSLLSGDTETNGVEGVYLVTGVEVEKHETLYIDFDYAFSVAARSSGEWSAESESTHFFRVRLGAFYRLSPHWLLGARFEQHGVSLPKGASVNYVPWDAQSEGLGVLLFQL